MKKTIIIISSLLLLIVISFTIYWNLPITVTRSSDIQFGNELIQHIETYRKINKKLPENNDRKTLDQLGFKKVDLGTQPDYKTDNNGNYELVYLDSFDSPYLLWNSKEKNWSIDFPKIYK